MSIINYIGDCVVSIVVSIPRRIREVFSRKAPTWGIYEETIVKGEQKFTSLRILKIRSLHRDLVVDHLEDGTTRSRQLRMEFFSYEAAASHYLTLSGWDHVIA